MVSKKAHKILLIDDDLSFISFCKDLIEKASRPGLRFEVLSCQDKSRSVEALAAEKPKLVIMNVNLRDGSGLELCRIFRENTDNSDYIGIILVSDHENSTLLAQGVGLGADDFLSKDRCQDELFIRIQSVLRVAQLANSLQMSVSKLITANKRLERLSIIDDLSTLYNMRYFKERLHQEMLRTHRYSKNLSLIMFDIDKFKEVNDSCDHLMGTFILGEVGKLVARNIRREVDFAARYGGDEFIIMMPETNNAGATVCAENLLRKIRETQFDNGTYSLQITVSIGVATIEPGSKITQPSDLIRMADHRLLAAKRLGRACIVSADAVKSLSA